MLLHITVFSTIFPGFAEKHKAEFKCALGKSRSYIYRSFHQHMELLLEVPEVIASNILVKWLNLSAVRNLDSAVCTHKGRYKFLTLAFNSGTVYENVPPDYSKHAKSREVTKYYQWLLLRGVLVCKIDLQLTVSKDTIRALIRANGHRLTSIRMVGQQIPDYSYPASRFMTEIADCCPNLSSFSLETCFLEGWAALSALLNTSSQLRKFKISSSGCIFTPKAELQIERSLDVRVIYMTQNGLHRPSFRELITHCPHLEELHVAFCRGDIGGVFPELGILCPNLHTLRLYNTDITDEHLAGFSEHCRTLAVLHTEDNNHFTDTGLTMLAKRCPLLHTLEICGEHNITNNPVAVFAKCCPKMWCVVLRGESFNDALVQYIAKHCQRLAHLSVKGCGNVSEESYRVVRKHCRYLQKIHVSQQQFQALQPSTVLLLKGCIRVYN